jgi:predicted ATPase
MTWTDKNYSIPLYSSQLSEGMLRFLWLVTILYCSESNSITLVDEPEVSLHPQLLCILSDIFREVSRKTHLFIATHSCRLIRFMHPSEVIVIDSENGQSQLKWADNLRLDNWLTEYNLDELWTMGRLGGKS